MDKNPFGVTENLNIQKRRYVLTIRRDSRIQQHMQNLQETRPPLKWVDLPFRPSKHNRLYARREEIRAQSDVGELREVREEPLRI